MGREIDTVVIEEVLEIFILALVFSDPVENVRVVLLPMRVIIKQALIIDVGVSREVPTALSLKALVDCVAHFYLELYINLL